MVKLIVMCNLYGQVIYELGRLIVSGEIKFG